MLTQREDQVTIECDKCHTKCTVSEKNYNSVFWDLGWVLNKGRKYNHLCFGCLPKKKRDSMDFVQNKRF